MTARFQLCLVRLLKHEGGKVDDPADRGGRTNMGVTQLVYSAYRKTRKRPDADVFDIEVSEVADIYENKYWVPVAADKLPVGVDFSAFDWAVNSGVGRAAKKLQEIVGVPPEQRDGLIGPKTLALVAKMSPSVIIHALAEKRYAFINAIVAAHPEQKRFIRGWQRRIAEVHSDSVADAKNV